MANRQTAQQTKDALAAEYTELRERLGLPYPYNKAVNMLTIKHLKHMIEDLEEEARHRRFVRDIEAQLEQEREDAEKK